MPAEELPFEPTPAFGDYKPFLEHAVAHPAKMNTKLLEFLTKSWTKPGETVLDPMAGSGSLGVIAALHGRNAVQVELEKKFYEWMEKARENVEKHQTLTLKGKIINICGDARRLSELLSRADVAITSPPYVESKPFHDLDFMKKIVGDQVERVKRGEIKGHYMTEKARKRVFEKMEQGKTLNPENIGNLPHGHIDTVITSPPYSESMTKKRKGYTIIPELAKTREMPQDTQDDNIANLPHGLIDTVITSPPYAEANRGGGIAVKGYEGKYGKDEKLPQRHDRPLSDNLDNISNLPFVDTVITSPPYAETYTGGGDPEKRKERLIKAGHDPKEFLGGKSRNAVLKHYSEVDTIITSPPYGDIEKRDRSRELWFNEDEERQKAGGSITIQKGYQGSPENVGNLPLGSVDVVITSPPYEASVSDNKESPLVGADEKKYGRWKKGTAKKHSYTQHGEPCKVDIVITSPPYAESLQGKPESQKKVCETPPPEGAVRKYRRKPTGYGYSERKENIGNLSLGDIDCCITSPPYEGSLEGSTRHTRGGIASRDPALAQTGSYATVMSFGVPVGYSPNKDNIGNFKKETYLQAMYRVYSEMFRVLKAGGHAIVVVKPFVRNKRVVDLPWHTWLLMQRVGFQLAKLYKLRLKQDSFWRILYYKKHPEVPRLRHEYVLVCRKPSADEQDEASSGPQVDPIEFLAETVRRERVNKTLSAFVKSLQVGSRA